MDQQQHVDSADVAAGAGSATYPPGVSVYDAEGEKLGTVSDRQDNDDFLVVHKGLLFGHNAYIPRAAIERSDADGVHLRVRKDDLKGMNQTPMPEPTAPIRHVTGAPETATTDQSLTAPLTPDISGPEAGMGAAAVAATAFSHDAAQESMSGNGSPVQSGGETARDTAGHAVEAARDAAGHAIEAARQGVGQATDFVREQVGPIAEQMRDQASEMTQQQMSSAAVGLDSAAGAVNAVGDRLRENNLGTLSQYTDLAAEQIEKAAAWLRATTPEEIARNAEDFAKKHPELFAATAIALGLIGMRFLRSASQDADEKKEDKK